MDRIFSNLPRVFIAAGILAPLLFYLMAGFTLDTPWHKWITATTFTPYAIASTIIFGGNIIFVRRDMIAGRLPTTWLVTLTYATGFFAILLWGACISTLVSNFYLHSEGSFTTRRIGFALMGAGLAGDGIAAIVLVVGLKKRLLKKRIHPWVWHRTRRDSE